MSELKIRAEELVAQAAELDAADTKVSAAPEGRIQDLIDMILDGLGNIDQDEAVAIIAKITEAVTAFASGRYLAGVFAVAAAFKLFNQARVNKIG